MIIGSLPYDYLFKDSLLDFVGLKELYFKGLADLISGIYIFANFKNDLL